MLGDELPHATITTSLSAEETPTPSTSKKKVDNSADAQYHILGGARDLLVGQGHLLEAVVSVHPSSEIVALGPAPALALALARLSLILVRPWRPKADL